MYVSPSSPYPSPTPQLSPLEWVTSETYKISSMYQRFVMKDKYQKTIKALTKTGRAVLILKG